MNCPLIGQVVIFEFWVDFRKSGFVLKSRRRAALMIASLRRRLSAEAVEGLSLSLQGVDDVHGRDGLAAGVLGVGNGVTDDVLEEDLEDAASLLVDETGDALHTATTGETADGGLGDALDVVAKDLAVALGAALSESLASLSSSRHDEWFVCSSTNRFVISNRLAARRGRAPAGRAVSLGGSF